MQGRHRQRRDQFPILIPLLIQLYAQLDKLPVKPPVTIALLALNIFVHVSPNPTILGYYLWDISSNCLQPEKIANSVFNYGFLPINRLLLSSIIHVDDMHLYYNMLSLCWKGANLEISMGSHSFLVLVVFSLVASHSLMVLLSLTLNMLLDNPTLSGYNSCAVGFSAVIFCLKYVWNQSCDDTVAIMGIQVPAKYSAWLELVLISIMSPNASFIGHLAGILAGILYVEAVTLWWRWNNKEPSEPRRSSSTYGSGRYGDSSSDDHTSGREDWLRRLAKRNRRTTSR